MTFRYQQHKAAIAKCGPKWIIDRRRHRDSISPVSDAAQMIRAISVPERHKLNAARSAISPPPKSVRRLYLQLSQFININAELPTTAVNNAITVSSGEVLEVYKRAPMAMINATRNGKSPVV